MNSTLNNMPFGALIKLKTKNYEEVLNVNSDRWTYN